MTVPRWEDAECLHSDAELFFPPLEHKVGSVAESRRQARVAQRVCFECPIRQECYAYAVQIKAEDGVWGGVWFHGTVRDTLKGA